jgi:hypothetical protein
MASVVGGLHVIGADSGQGHAPVPPVQLGAFSLYLMTQPQSLGSGQDMLLGGSHHTIGGASSTGADTAAGAHGVTAGAGQGSGFDTVTGPDHGMPVAGAGQPTADQVVATATHQQGNTTLHFGDGSSMTLIGTAHIDPSFFH